MTEGRKGRQTPTRSVVLPYTSTLGGEAIEIYNSTGRTAQEWQELLVSDILAYNEDGLWIHTKYGYSVPRRNGKNEKNRHQKPGNAVSGSIYLGCCLCRTERRDGLHGSLQL